MPCWPCFEQLRESPELESRLDAVVGARDSVAQPRLVVLIVGDSRLEAESQLAVALVTWAGRVLVWVQAQALVKAQAQTRALVKAQA